MNIKNIARVVDGAEVTLEMTGYLKELCYGWT